ncbi:XrtA system polysaccharide chain length determinant [Pseudomonadota bacterium]
MQEVLVQVFSYVRGIWKRRWWMLLVAWMVSVAGWVVVLKMPDQYASSAKVYVDTHSVLQPLLRGIAIQSDVDQQVQLMTKTIFTRPNLEKVARMADLDLEVSNDKEMEALLNSIKDRVEMISGGRQNIFTISYEDPDPSVAKSVVQAFLTVFVESSLGSSRKESNVAQKFIDEQIAEYEERLEESEAELMEFKQKNVGLMPGRGSDYFSMLKDQRDQLKAAQDHLSEIITRRDEIKRQMATEEPTIGLSPTANIFGSGMSHPLDLRIAEVEVRLDDLLLKYTEKHPDVQSNQSTLTKLKEQRQKDIDEAKKNIPEVANATPLQQNPVYQQLKIALGQVSAEIVAMKRRVAKGEEDVESLEGLVDTIPEVEAEMKRLNRDYDIVKGNYDELLARREAARVARDADATGDSVKFDVVEPPRIPLKPSGPNRPLFLTAVLVAGLAIGVALAFLLSQLKQTFDTRTSLREAIGLPVLGSISMEWSAKQRLHLRLETAFFTAVGSFLLLVYVAVVMAEDRLVVLLANL